jgi:hypothetical protein
MTCIYSCLVRSVWHASALFYFPAKNTIVVSDDRLEVPLIEHLWYELHNIPHYSPSCILLVIWPSEPQLQ